MTPLKTRIFALAALSILGTTRICSADLNLSQYNLIASGNLVSDSSDIQGRVIVGGTMSVNNFTFGGQLPAGSAGPAGVFGTLGSGVSTLNANGNTYVYGGPTGAIAGQAANPSAVATYTNGLASYLSHVSTAYGAMATNSTVNASDRNQIAFTATPTTIGGRSVAVFSVDQSFFASSGTVSKLTGFDASTTIIINVTGGTPGNDPLNFANFSPFQNATNQANILFNFENATSLAGVNNLGGSILAPSADLSTSMTLVGSVYVKDVLSVGEIDLPKLGQAQETGFIGYVPNVSAVPEPSAIVLTLMGLGASGAWGWRRRRAG